MAPYATRGGVVSQAGTLFALTLANPEGHHLCCLALGPEGTFGIPRMLYQSHREFWNPVLSHRGELAVIASTARAGKRQFSLLAFDTNIGRQIAELWAGGMAGIAIADWTLNYEDALATGESPWKS
jgi:hypothetical protein